MKRSKVNSNPFSENATLVPRKQEKEEEENEEEEEEENENDKKKSRSNQYAIKFEEVLEEVMNKKGEIEDEQLDEFFNIPIGKKWRECDCNVPKKLQFDSLWYLGQLSQVQWDTLDIQTDPSKPLQIISISAIGKVRSFPKEDDDDEKSKELPVRVEYREAYDQSDSFSLPLNIYITSIGNVWGCMHGVRSELPFVSTNDIVQSASDDGNGFRFPLVLPNSDELTKEQRFESILGNMIVNFNLACRNWN